MYKKHLVKFICMLCLVIFSFSVCAMTDGTPVDFPTEEDGTEINTSTKIEKEKFYLVAASKKSAIYDESKKNIAYYVFDGDSLVMAESQSDKEWTQVFINGYDIGYIKTSNLKAGKNESIIKKKLKTTGPCYLLVFDKSHYVYTSNKKDSRIGVMRKGVSLPILDYITAENYYPSKSKVATFDGIGYVYSRNGMLGDREDMFWDNMYKN